MLFYILLFIAVSIIWTVIGQRLMAMNYPYATQDLKKLDEDLRAKGRTKETMQAYKEATFVLGIHLGPFFWIYFTLVWVRALCKLACKFAGWWLKVTKQKVKCIFGKHLYSYFYQAGVSSIQRGCVCCGLQEQIVKVKNIETKEIEYMRTRFKIPKPKWEKIDISEVEGIVLKPKNVEESLDKSEKDDRIEKDETDLSKR